MLALCSAMLIYAYNPLQENVNNTAIPTGWDTGDITWSLNPTNTNVDTSSGTTIPQSLGAAFSAWQSTQFNSQTLNTLAFTQGLDSTLTQPNSTDCVNVIGFTDSTAADFPTGVVAFTQLATATNSTAGFTYSCTSAPTSRTCSFKSCIADADMEFNPNEQFSTATPTPASDFDLRSIATHEIGHMIGLDHSGLAHGVMYPFGDTGVSEQRNLAIDDVMGAAFMYPASNFASATAAISGKITLGSSNVFAAHVIAVDSTTGNVVMDTLTSPDGTYTLDGVPQGNYNILILPLAPDANSGIYTIDDFSGWACGYATDVSACTGFPNNPTNYTGTFF
jgi:hypothetical protein